ncbi:MAG: transglycosylase domain-containing protein [Erythrobacter sp.]|jgi:penicillin-binding protein 1A|uniref:transglycosylase domain-containing protein n=1 Tax=Qipengyuania citrea TaxID=225971 RepID=UPI001A594CDA|nr:transglycosylase domain-containing protein [Qipengyuania citrea]MBL4717786.1 transglycosylase domain-containing protein [Erythrobacter sp.]MCP2016997.1 penicillin-binding protein 1A [Qipengyuania citrea]MDE0901042.1 transglycosylase domain-containing protein [Erythrobacter sp.]
MGVFNLFRRRPQPHAELPSHSGYYATHDALDYDDWDSRLDRLDSALEAEEKKRLRWWQRDYWRGRRKRWWLGRILAAIIGLFIVLVAWLAITAPLSKSLEPIAAPQITLLAADGTPIARNGAITDEPVAVADLPPHVIAAFLATEDRRFYSHWGIDPRGIARAAFTGTGGGSTITQQLAKFTFLTPERTLTRKAREALIAFWLESWLTKDDILSRYLSNAYFGDNVYGLRAASLHYFYRKPENLKPNQAAMLAGLLQAPSAYAPTRHYDRAERRMRIVVQSMVDAGYITEAEARAMKPPALDVRTRNDLPTGTYFADWALPGARELTEQGYERQTLTTTLDSRLQNIARQVTQRAPLGGAQVALVAMRRNGEVVAMIGGKDYAKSPFNRATQAKRQPGSTIKTFVYLAALRDGWSPDDEIANTEITEGSYRPRNANERYSDTITLRDALARSSNVATLRLFNEVGSEKVIQTARDFGIRASFVEGDPSVALGSTSMTLIELTAAYAGIAANAFPVEPHAFAREEKGWWETLWDGPGSLSGRTHDDIQGMLRAAINDGTGRAAMLRGPNFGKTGTSQDNRDALFVGYAGDLVVGVWIGNDDNSPLAGGISGGGLPAKIWRDFMNGAMNVKAAPSQPAPREQNDPGTPIEPLDVPGLDDIPLGDGNSRLRIRDGEAVFSTEIDGIPVDITIGEDGLAVDEQAIEEARRRADERRFEAIRNRRDERLRETEDAGN